MSRSAAFSRSDNPNISPEIVKIGRELAVGLCLIAGVGGFGGDATASGRLSWLERGGHCFEPIRKPGGLSQNQALF